MRDDAMVAVVMTVDTACTYRYRIKFFKNCFHASNLRRQLFLAVVLVGGDGSKSLMNGSCAWWVSGSSLFNHLDLW
jgi:hypothetical protein